MNFMQVESFEGVWASGDCASVPDLKTEKPFPPTVNTRSVKGKFLPDNLKADDSRWHEKTIRF